ncbi:41013_t:CDS:10 [Gigaspora margarita]|uniref:41013_t:CDS:1 n=1 Tax=Gigaspora margarita TaxID=4874 RepID=A0ABN7UCQ3_GIGMA|nr:41013_t:CDS:10 [Gigaspora margarita]
MTEKIQKTQETPIEVDLKVMCFKCGLRAEGSKTELVNRLEAFWNEHEPEPEPEKDQEQPEIGKRKSTDQKFGENRLEEKIDEKLTALLSRVLDRSLQQWTAKVNGVSAIKTSFPKKKFKRTRDQYEYDSVCDTGALLQKAIQEDSKEKFAEVQERLRLRAFTLRVAEEEGWTMARKILKPIPNEGNEFKDLLVEARKQAKSQEGYSVLYNRRSWQTKGKKFGVGVQFTPSTLPTPSTPSLQPHLNHGVFPNPGPTYQSMFNKLKGSTRGSRFFEVKPVKKVGNYAREKEIELKSREEKGMDNMEQSREVVRKIYESAAVRYWMEKINPPPVVACWLKNQSEKELAHLEKLDAVERVVLWASSRHRKGASNSTEIEVRGDKEMLESTDGCKLGYGKAIGKDHGKVVAAASGIGLGGPASTRVKGHICGWAVGVHRTLKKFEMEILGGAHLAAKAEKYWTLYEKFWKENFRKSLAVAQVLRAIKKEVSKSKTPDWPRDLLPVAALRHYMEVPPSVASGSMHRRDVALVALGLRTMRRPGELGELTMKDIRWDNNGILWAPKAVFVNSTSDESEGTIVPIETRKESLGSSDWLGGLRGNCSNDGRDKSLANSSDWRLGLDGCDVVPEDGINSPVGAVARDLRARV